MASVGATYYGNSTGSTTVTVPSVNASLGDKVIVMVTWRLDAAETLSSVTFNGSGTGWTEIADLTEVDDIRCGVYEGVGLSGTQSVVVTHTAATTDTHVGIVVISNAGTTGTPATASDNDGSISASVTTASTSALIIALNHLRTTGVADEAVTSPGTLQQSGESTFGSTGMLGTRAGTAGSTAIEFTYTNGGFSQARMIVVGVEDAGGGAAYTPRMMLMGVG